MLVGCATAASLFPFVGTIVYMILRPPEYLEDVRERELEVQAAEARLHEFDHSLCPHCDYRIERDFVRCPSCLRKLKERCVNCSRPLDQAWTICPYCETEVAAPAPARTRRRRTQAAIDAEQAELATTSRPETARAKAARARVERDGRGAPPMNGPATSRTRGRRPWRPPSPPPGPAAGAPAAARGRAPRPRNPAKEPMDRTLILVKPDAFARGPDRRDHRPLRAQGPEDRRAAQHDRRPRAGRTPLRRARRAPVLRRAGRLHHLRARSWRSCWRA